MHRLSTEEVKKYQLNILDVVVAFCEERRINYFLDFGTLIGAVRHKGYIPWDDDIDISMLRPDYNRFMKEFNGYNTRYEFHCIENDPDTNRVFGYVVDKNTGINGKGCIIIDIFVHDNAPDDDNAARKMFRMRMLYHRLNDRRSVPVFSQPTRIKKKGLVRRVSEYFMRGVLRIFPKTYFAKKIIAISKQCISQKTKRVGNFSGYQEAMIDREAFTSLIDMEFEGKMYKVPSGYDRWLRELYGDYMQLPPVEEREGHHYIEAYGE